MPERKSAIPIRFTMVVKDMKPTTAKVFRKGLSVPDQHCQRGNCHMGVGRTATTPEAKRVQPDWKPRTRAGSSLHIDRRTAIDSLKPGRECCEYKNKGRIKSVPNINIHGANCRLRRATMIWVGRKSQSRSSTAYREYAPVKPAR